MAKMNLFFLKNCIPKISTPLGTSSVEEKLILERFCRARVDHHLFRSSVAKPHLCATDRLLLAMNWNARTVEAKLVEFELPLFSLSITCPRLVFKKTWIHHTQKTSSFPYSSTEFTIHYQTIFFVCSNCPSDSSGFFHDKGRENHSQHCQVWRIS